MNSDWVPNRRTSADQERKAFECNQSGRKRRNGGTGRERVGTLLRRPPSQHPVISRLIATWQLFRGRRSAEREQVAFAAESDWGGQAGLSCPERSGASTCSWQREVRLRHLSSFGAVGSARIPHPSFPQRGCLSWAAFPEAAIAVLRLFCSRLAWGRCEEGEIWR